MTIDTDCTEPAPSAGVSDERLMELLKLYADDAARFPKWPLPNEIASAFTELLSARSRIAELEKQCETLSRMHKQMCELAIERFERIAELEAGVDDALGTLIGCCIPAGGVDDRKAMLDCQVRLRALLPKESGNG